MKRSKIAELLVAGVAVTMLVGCGRDVGMENLGKIETEILELSKDMEVAPNLLPSEDLDLVEERAVVEDWGQVRAENGKVQLNYEGRYLCLTLQDGQGRGRSIVEGPCF
jgi:hypothetical protein